MSDPRQHPMPVAEPTQEDSTGKPAEDRSYDDPRSRTVNAVVALGLLAALFVAVNVLAGPWLRGYRLDLTQDKLYSLSQGTRQVLAELSRSEPVRVTMFYSKEASAGRPAVQAYAQRVKELLEEYSIASGGVLSVQVVDPKPYSAEEARAQAAGIPSLPAGADGQAVFLGIEAAGPTDLRGTIPFLDPQQESFLEYELTKLIVSVRSPLKPIVGVITGLPLRGQAIQGGRGGPWFIWQELALRYELRDLGQDFSTIDQSVRALLIAHPVGLSEQALRAIDQAVLAGIPAVVLVDPVCESVVPAGFESNPALAFQADRSSSLGELLGAWGVDLLREQVVGDFDSAARVNSRSGVVPYLPYLQLGGERFSRDDPVTRQIDSMLLASAGALTQTQGATTTLTPLIQTSTNSMLIDAELLSPLNDPRDLLDAFAPSGQPITLAARIRGPAASAYEDAPIQQGNIDVLVISDADMLTNQFWLEEVGFGGMSMGYRRLSDNGDLILNAIELAAGDRAMLSLRGRGTSSRPFTRVEQLQREADQRYAEELKELEAKRADVENQIAMAQQADPEEGLAAQLILTPQQAARVESFRDELIATNQRLREVRFELGQDVDRLEAIIKGVNIAGGPMLVGIVAVVLVGIRRAQRSVERRSPQI